MKKTFFLALLALFLAGKPLFAAEDYSAIDLEKIVVTPGRTAEAESEVGQAVSVITSDEIGQSNAQSIVGVLNYEPGVYVKDYYGTGTRATVDIRGFGESSPNNVLVLIDGRRVNEIDLSGADWTQIPLDQIERIEISRGGSSVLYGDNAIGGVINIITKTGKGQPKISLSAEAGSYNLYKHNLGISGAKNDLAYSFNVSDHSTAGYRLNSFYRSFDLGTKLVYDLLPAIKLTLSGGYHDAHFGLPGFLSENDLNTTFSRRDSKFPDDHVGETDGFSDFEIKNKINDENEVSAAFSFRQRRVTDQLLSSFYVDNRQISTTSVRPKYTLTKELLGRQNSLIAGFDFYSYRTVIDEYGSDGSAKTRDTDINRLSNAFYFQDDFNLTPKLLFNAGYRDDHTRTTFNSTPLPGDFTGAFVDDKISVNEKVYKVGVNYQYSEGSKVFANFSRNFRIPATDEYFSVFAIFSGNPPVNTALLPQTSLDNEWGIEHRFNRKLKMDLNLFHLDLKNELFYNNDPLVQANQNADGRTRHQGIEYGFDYAALDWLGLYGNYTYTDAKFTGGQYQDKNIPGVARNMANAGMRVKLIPDWEWLFTSQYTGKSYLISDFNNRADKLKSYTVFNTRLTYKKNDYEVYAGVNNLLGEKYSEYGLTNFSGTSKVFYPAARRNFVFGAKKEF